MPTNYKQLFAISAKIEKQLKQACPELQHKSGIYFLTREEDTDEKAAYIGLGVDVCRRMISHVQGYQQRIDISLKKRGFYDKENNPLGWKLNVIYFPEAMLEEKERYYIDMYKNAGYEMYNIESGGRAGKTNINERKPAKGYKDGIAQGQKTLKRELNKIINKYLVISTKVDNKLSQRMLEKFYEILNENEKKPEE